MLCPTLNEVREPSFYSSLPTSSPQKSLEVALLTLKNRQATELQPAGLAGRINHMPVSPLSNEIGIEKTLQAIEEYNKVPTDKPKCHLGVGALPNFDIMAARLSDYGVVFHSNPHNREFMNQALEFIQSSSTPEEFVDKITEYMKSNIDKYNKYSTVDRMKAELKRPTSWLFSRSKFQHIKKLATEGKIIAITQDFSETQVFQDLKVDLEKLGLPLDTLYLANQHGSTSEANFYATFDVLTESQPITIHSSPPINPPTICPCPNPQSCACAKEQSISRTWLKTGTQNGALKPTNLESSSGLNETIA